VPAQVRFPLTGFASYRVTSSAVIGTAINLPSAGVIRQLTRKQWREGDVALLKAAAARFEMYVPDQWRFTASTDD
jgi:hypothetical protein